MPTWLVLAIAAALAAATAFVLVVGWRDEERRTRAFRSPPQHPPGPSPDVRER